MRSKLLVLLLAAALALFGGCGFNTDSDTATDTEATDTGDTGATDTDDTGETGDTEDTGDTGDTDTDTDTDETTEERTEETTDETTEETTEDTSSPEGPIPPLDYSPQFRDSFVEGCIAGDPARESACRCIIDRIAETIPIDELLTNPTSPEIIQITQECGLS